MDSCCICFHLRYSGWHTRAHTHSVLPYTNRNLTTVLSCLGLLTSLRRQGCSDKVAFTEATCLHNSVMDNWTRTKCQVIFYFYSNSCWFFLLSVVTHYFMKNKKRCVRNLPSGSWCQSSLLFVEITPEPKTAQQLVLYVLVVAEERRFHFRAARRSFRN